MQSRERLLLILFCAAIGIWGARPIVQSQILDPLAERTASIRNLRKQLDDRETRQMALLRDARRLREFAEQSLPPEPLTAQRLYQKWITDQAAASGWGGVQVTPERRIDQGEAGASVQVQLEGEASLDQLCRFLFDVHRAELLQQIVRLEITAPGDGASRPLQIKLLTEGFALASAPLRDWLFPEAALLEPLTPDAESAMLTPVEAAFDVLAQTPGMRLRIGSELMLLRSQEDGRWSLERGMDGTRPAAHSAGTVAQLLPLAEAETPAAGPGGYRSLVRLNPFRPWTPLNPRLNAPGTRQTTPGGQVEVTLTAEGFETDSLPVQFELRDADQPGMTIDQATGRFTWTPPDDLSPGEYKATAVALQEATAADGSDTRLQAEATVLVNVRLANTPPQFLAGAGEKPLEVIIGETLEVNLLAWDAETADSDLRYRVVDAPAGLSIDQENARLTWTPPDSISPGEFQLQLEVSDNSEPPATDSRKLNVTVIDNAARYTFLVASVVIDGQPQGWLYDRASNRRMILRPGGTLDYAGRKATVRDVLPGSVTFARGPDVLRLTLGQNLSELELISTSRPAATGPAQPEPAEVSSSSAEPAGAAADTAAVRPPVEAPRLEKSPVEAPRPASSPEPETTAG
ncbi:MAG: putative Ig domain-containing protein, partial [Planctomycetaceae bacterium]|nr:putative Ig domain-containing protein [Planctomycetaceae bacterium]